MERKGPREGGQREATVTTGASVGETRRVIVCACCASMMRSRAAYPSPAGTSLSHAHESWSIHMPSLATTRIVRATAQHQAHDSFNRPSPAVVPISFCTWNSVDRARQGPWLSRSPGTAQDPSATSFNPPEMESSVSPLPLRCSLGEGGLSRAACRHYMLFNTGVKHAQRPWIDRPRREGEICEKEVTHVARPRGRNDCVPQSYNMATTTT